MASGLYTVERLGARQSMTNEGFLLCEGVPIARTGELLYAAGEVPVETGSDGIIHVDRTADEVFRAETMASFEGKPVTMDHPADFVTPETWRQLAVGITRNVRRGDGLDDDYILADMLITDRSAIDAVRAGLREVSCGYDADYEQIQPGRGVQRNIIGNHVALVERGRCGPRCAIGDKEPEMAKKTWMDKLRAAFKSKDEAAMEEALKEADTTDAEGDEDDDKDKDDKSGKTGDSVMLGKILKTLDALNKRVGDMEAAAKEKDDEDENKTKDTVLEAEEAKANTEAKGETYTGDMATVRSNAEILAPGIKLPTHDSKTKTADAICACQRKALDTAYGTDAGRAAIDVFLAGRAPEFGTMDASAVATIFNGAAALRRHQNNTSGARSGISTRDFGRATTVASINDQNRKFWDARTGK
ncbi:hypothetical protein CEY04_27590 [Achromobacter sp. HZ28]|nr:hypothetical protein CEY05_28760 [Achromobacter sp. HZ34]OWT70675.1 hypothetical protein CEY04_27590 [Achromobacter sp. HZ28]